MRNYLIQSAGDLKRKVICVLDQVFPEYQTIFSNTFGTTSKQLLLDYSSPSDFEELSVEDLTKTLETLSRKKVGQSTAAKLISSAKNSFGITFSKESFKFQLKLLIEQIQFIDNQVKECETKIKELMEKINSCFDILFKYLIALSYSSSCSFSYSSCNRFCYSLKLTASFGKVVKYVATICLHIILLPLAKGQLHEDFLGCSISKWTL